jgi:hypothetical protein
MCKCRGLSLYIAKYFAIYDEIEKNLGE